jgi:hypothetical protein
MFVYIAIESAKEHTAATNNIDIDANNINVIVIMASSNNIF